jgi:hypothetical protein
MTREFSVTGYRSDGLVVADVFDTVGAVFFETALLGAEWTGLDLVVFDIYSPSNAGAAFDNLVISMVPFPAAASLFGSALACLGCLKRRQSV